MFYELYESSKQQAVIQCVSLLGLKNPEAIKKEKGGAYSHTNSRNKKRYFLPCLNQGEYNQKIKDHPEANYRRCRGYYVLYWNAPSES